MFLEIWFALNIAVFVLAFFALSRKDDTSKFMVPFLGILIAIFTILGVNSDGGIVTHYPAFSGDATVTATVWPSSYLTLFGFILNVAVELRFAVSK